MAKVRGESNGGLRGRLQRMRAAGRDLAPVLPRIGALAARLTARRAPRGGGPGRIGPPLATSFGYRVEGDDAVAVISDKPYARIQHYGGTIAPLTRRFLAVPVSDAARRLIAGVGAAEGLRSVPGLFVLVSRGRAFLARHSQAASQAAGSRVRRDRRGRTRVESRIGLDDEGRQVEILFVLKARVSLPARPYVATWEDEELRQGAAQALRRHLGGGT
ncbi:MAG: hypothetical protein LC135_01830 [Phycisphaerae bacterium]|nr:hypothetical protein [Phycisphaerae bacterium]MCZ2398593.1 hypothetical protein [Phycisphaerae bacterium]